MDQLPVEISQRIRHEARVAGLNEHAPSIEMVERRRLQLWSLTIIIMIGIGLASLAVSGATGQTSWITGDPWILAGGVSVLAVGFCIYAVEKEVHLHRLSRLLVDERMLSNTMAQQLQMNTALFNAGKALNSVLDLDEVLDAILANALELLGSVGGSVMLLEDQSVLRVVAVRGEGTVRDARVRLGESMVGRVAKSREPLLVTTELAAAELSGAIEPDVEIGGAMCVPLVNRGQLLGVLNVLAPKSVEFQPEDLSVLSLFAEPVAAAIAKAGLYEAERANVAKLLESDRMKSQFVASVSHELRTPITSIRGAVAASRRTDQPGQREELLDVVDRQSGRLQAMVEEMLVAARMQENANRPTMQQIDLCALVQLTALDSQVAGRPVELDLPRTCAVRAEPEALQRVLTNLIENAHKYGGAPIRVSVQITDDAVVMSVTDHGPGVPPDERDRVFERFYRVDPNGTKPGMGLGLSIVRGLVESCGGKVWVEDAPGGGAAFRVALRTSFMAESRPEALHV
ncbi:MAG: GAF domain-containing protein [Acidimicrobiia bacterium]|nr:GAF domain-containing protein [Acidimicrobiia bacterium]